MPRASRRRSRVTPVAWPFAPLALVAPLAGCTTFATVRPADVASGASLALHASLSSPPGDVAGWFWALDCADACDHHVPGADLGLTYGWRLRDAPVRAIEVSAGTSGPHPYVDGYVQLTGGRHPVGVGARAGLPVYSWREHQLYARFDVPLATGARLMLDPGLFVHEGRAPNGASPGRFVGFVQGVGVLAEGERVSVTPAASLVVGRAQRDSYGRRFGPVWSVFGTAGIGVTLHRARAPR